MAALLVSVLASACRTVTPEEIGLADSHRDLAEVKLSMNEPELAIKEYQAAIRQRSRRTRLGGRCRRRSG